MPVGLGHLLKSDSRNGAERFLIERCYRVAPLSRGGQLTQAVQSHQSVELRQASINTGKRAVVLSVVPVLASHADSLSQLAVVRCHDSALAGDDELGRTEAEDVRVG